MSRPITLPSPWRELAYAAGGVRQLADALGVEPRTVHRWAHGKRKPGGSAQKILEQLTKDLPK